MPVGRVGVDEDTVSSLVIWGDGAGRGWGDRKGVLGAGRAVGRTLGPAQT